MNTLNCKVLLTKTVAVLFIRAIGIYLLVTLPALAALPAMYEVSALYALSFGWIAALVFLGFFYILQKINTGIRTKQFFLYASVIVAVGVAFQMMEFAGAQDHIWQSGAFLLFPFAAVISGWISVAVSRRCIITLFNYTYVNMAVNTSSAPENSN